MFFCQVEAAETVIWLTEVAKDGTKDQKKLYDAIAAHSEAANPGLIRLAMKLATGAGKTTVMAMLIAWHAVNKARRSKSKTFTDAFLIVTPGITIKDRLRVLRPEAPDSIYRALSIVPPDMMGDLLKARIVITNYHAFQRKSAKPAPGTAEVLRGREDKEDFDERFRETDGAMIQRVMSGLMGRRGIIVINDEAHHCYQAKPKPEDGKPTIVRAEEETAAEAKADADANNEAARVWINGIRTVQSVLDVKAVYDLSATPFFLRGSGYREGELFGWVVSDFSLMDAIESGIVKVPRVPTRDDVIEVTAPVYRHIYKHIRRQLSRRGRRSGGGMAASQMPGELEGALRALYRDYVKRDEAWKGKAETPPVFIVVCNNTTTSKMVYEWIAGHCTNPDAEEGEQVWRRGELELFSNVDRGGKPLARRRTILIDSAQLESGDALDDKFRDVAREEIEAFRKERRQRDLSADSEKEPDDTELLREVMNTVGRKGRLGEQVRCIVSVSMLTEGWDANTVTHVLGCRAFGTQLLCEQVVGRALRRTNYDPDDQGMLSPQYAEVLGVPFSFMPANSAADFKPPKPRHRVFADRERPAPEIRFPRLEGYRVEFPKGQLQARFTPESRLEISAVWPQIPEQVITDPLIGASNVLESDLGGIREQTIAFMLAKRTLEQWSRLSGETDIEPVTLFPQFLRLARDWLASCLDLKDGRTVGYLALTSLCAEAVARMVRACAEALDTAGPEKIRPMVLADPTGSSRFVDFHTTRTSLMRTDPDRCQVNYVLWDSTWEAAFAERLEQLPRVRGYVKNAGLGFEAPYTFLGQEHAYRPDFIVALDDGRPDPLYVVAEIKGFRGPDAEAKRDTLVKLWKPAVNNDGRWGRWETVEIKEPTDMMASFEAQALADADGQAQDGSVAWRDAARGGEVLAEIGSKLEEAVERAQHLDTADAA